RVGRRVAAQGVPQTSLERQRCAVPGALGGTFGYFRPALLHGCQRRLPQALEGVRRQLAAGGFGDGPALVLVVQVVLQERFQVVVGVQDALAAVLKVRRHLAVARLLEQERARRRGLEGSAVGLGADAVVEDDAGAAEQPAVGLAKNARADVDT